MSKIKLTGMSYNALRTRAAELGLRLKSPTKATLIMEIERVERTNAILKRIERSEAEKERARMHWLARNGGTSRAALAFNPFASLKH
jgi:hypothetical protein